MSTPNNSSHGVFEEEHSFTRMVEMPSDKMPKGIPYIIGNEAAERFSFYGMRTILVTYMTKHLLDKTGALAVMSDVEASNWYHMFMMASFFFPVFGALLADIYWSKYKTIMRLSWLYCLGHLVLAIGDTSFGIHTIGMKNCLAIGLGMIALGAGGIKPVVSAHVGDQFTPRNKHLIEKVFSIFYFSINLGSFFSTLLTPLLLKHFGPSVAFGLPGVLMLIATIVFKIGDRVYTSIPAVGWEKYKQDLLSPRGLKAIGNLGLMYLCVAVFWSLFDQHGSSWVLQAERMNRTVDLGFTKFTLLAEQIQALNPIMVMGMIPIFSMFLYPWVSKFFPMRPMRKISVGMFVAAFSFTLIATAQTLIDTGHTPGMMWQFWAFLILTASEVMVSITCLEFSYTQAPNSMKSFIMGLYLLSTTVGNFLAVLVNSSVEFLSAKFTWAKLITLDEVGKPQFAANYFWLFVILMALTGVVFAFIASRYKEEEYVQSH